MSRTFFRKFSFIIDEIIAMTWCGSIFLMFYPLKTIFPGRLERAVRLQRPRSQHLPLRCPQRRRHRPLPVSLVHSSPRRQGSSLCQVKGQRSLVRVSYYPGVCRRTEGSPEPAQPAVQLRPLHREVRGVLLRLRQPGHHWGRGGCQDGLCAYIARFRSVSHFFYIPLLKLKV